MLWPGFFAPGAPRSLDFELPDHILRFGRFAQVNPHNTFRKRDCVGFLVEPHGHRRLRADHPTNPFDRGAFPRSKFDQEVKVRPLPVVEELVHRFVFDERRARQSGHGVDAAGAHQPRQGCDDVALVRRVGPDQSHGDRPSAAVSQWRRLHE